MLGIGCPTEIAGEHGSGCKSIGMHVLAFSRECLNSRLHDLATQAQLAQNEILSRHLSALPRLKSSAICRILELAM